MNGSIHWAGLALRATVIEGVGVALRTVDPGADRLALPLLARRVWELCCRAPVKVEGVDEVAASNVELLVQTRRDDLRGLCDAIGAKLEPLSAQVPRRFRLPVCFEHGTDWDFVEQHTGLDRERVIGRLIAGTYALGMFGFLPGFAYLLGLDAALHCPRKITPAPRIAAGSVALGGEYLGVYGVASPAGWQSIGRTPVAMGSLGQVPPLFLDVGDTLQIDRIDARAFVALEDRTLREFCVDGEGERGP